MAAKLKVPKIKVKVPKRIKEFAGNHRKINLIIDRLSPNFFTTWIDRLPFMQVLLVWAFIIAMFGVYYHAFANDSAFLYHTKDGSRVEGVMDKVYFSFITATTTGFGDIAPKGYFKVITIMEVVLGLLLLAFVTSKIVSLKQDIILTEIYEISFNERMNRLRSSLMLFRNNLSRMISSIEEKKIKKREIGDIYIYLSQFEDSLNEITDIVEEPEKSTFKMNIDSLNAELIFSSIIQSFERINELLLIMKSEGIDWKRDINVFLINKCSDRATVIRDKLASKHSIPEKNLSDMSLQLKSIMDMIKADVPKTDTPITEAKQESK
ncbi:two pore domain potassium channel family protein [Candidatus Woesearchaeota archaeon]|nr:two pore domain potassium channel family protein [Candidatus Woesearchaeota archaeon]